MATKKSKSKAPETVRITARPVFNINRAITHWEVSNGSTALSFKSEGAALKSLNATVKRNVRRYIVVAEHVGADGKVKGCREYTRQGAIVVHKDLPVAASVPKKATPNTAPATPGQKVATEGKTTSTPAPKKKTPKTKKEKTPKAKTPKAKKELNKGLEAYQSWRKAYCAAHPNCTKESIKKAWAAHKGTTPTAPKKKTPKTKKTTTAPKTKTPAAPKKKTPKTKKPKTSTPGTRLEPLPKAGAKKKTPKAKADKTAPKKKTPKAGSYTAFVKAFAATYKGDPKGMMKAAGAAWQKQKG